MTTRVPTSATSGLDLDFSGEISWTKFDELTQSLDIAEIEQAYRLLELEEARVDVEISESVETGEEINMKFAGLSILRDNLYDITEQLAPAQAAIEVTAANAGAISGRVRFLDREQEKLERALNMVVDTDLLKRRLAELLNAMRDKDIDVAAALVHKYIATESTTLNSPLVMFASPSSDARASTATGGDSRDDKFVQLDNPAQIISVAAKELTERVSYMFETAVETNNTKEISHCFRLFPLLGEELRGLDLYSEFLCNVIAEKSRVSGDIQNNIYAIRITRLFEVIATVIDNHFPLVETHYGPGRMVRVMQRLQMEGAKRAALVLDFFEEERHIKRRLSQIQQADASALQANTQSRVQLLSVDRGRTGRYSEEDISDNDFKDITSIISELVLIERQIAAFSRFMESRSISEMKALSSEPMGTEKVFMAVDAIAKLIPLTMQGVLDIPITGTTSGNTSRGAVFDEHTGLISHTPLSLRLPWLTETFISFETFFLTKSIAKAMSLDDSDDLSGWTEPLRDDIESSSVRGSGALAVGSANSRSKDWLKKHIPGLTNAPLGISQTSSCVGDVFFVVRTSLEHAIATQQVSAVEAIAQHAIGVVNSMFLSVVEARALKKWVTGAGGPGNGSNSGSGRNSRALQLGISTGESGWRLPGVRTQHSGISLEQQPTDTTSISPQASAQREILVALNNLDLSCTYMKQTADSLNSKIDSEWQRVPKLEHATRAQKAIDTLAALSAKFAHSKQRSLEQLGLHVLKPWVRSILQQSYRDIKYVLTDEEFNDVQNDNLFQKRFVLKFGSLAQQLKHRLSAKNYSAAIENAIASLSTDWERAIRQSKFNMLGGIMFEKDVRELQRYLEQESGVVLRHKFVRLVQMADILAIESIADANYILESQPAVDMPSNPQTPPSLSKSDIKALLINRIDISEKEMLSLNIQ
ncbi:Golgi transport complex subunit 4 [Coemansia spiralis]|uniref:Conserved oligomeric Golgi complex subunit 4 n=2 Tax=Coemansia TaxID=4863 RepID=A0A9W8L0P1_9FUNG|nr:Golgi transport complex subunit 4 [Coemansia umbellata]KAJ2625079.1 Golgi transport complex subunit 4 [Coemansia sp. RSA 1358]KAJ2679967.1 Golgi transport complex subunit 4 [Coemansia spiralis]